VVSEENPITLRHSGRELVNFTVAFALVSLAVGVAVWFIEGPGEVRLVVGTLGVAWPILLLVLVTVRLRYGPGHPIEYRCFGPTRTIPLDTILAWTPSCRFSPDTPVIHLTVRRAPGPRTRRVSIGVPGSREDYERFAAFLSTLMPPTVP